MHQVRYAVRHFILLLIFENWRVDVQPLAPGSQEPASFCPSLKLMVLWILVCSVYKRELECDEGLRRRSPFFNLDNLQSLTIHPPLELMYTPV